MSTPPPHQSSLGNVDSAETSETLPDAAFDCFETLVASHVARQEDDQITRAWQVFSDPTAESASRLHTANVVIRSGAGASFTAGMESIQFQNRGSVVLRRAWDPTRQSFRYSLQLLVVGKSTVEKPVVLATVVTAIRGGVSVLAAALAADPGFMDTIRIALFEENEFSMIEQVALKDMLKDAKRVAETRSSRL